MKLLLVLAAMAALSSQHSAMDYFINHPQQCATKGENVTLLVMVTSAVDHLVRRMAIRESWGAIAQSRDVVLLFLLGDPLTPAGREAVKEEDSLYGDIVQGTFHDTYRNLTLKSLCMLHWTTAFCPHVQFLMKIDDDCILHPPNLFKAIEKAQRIGQPTISGLVLRSLGPVRDNGSKWFVSEEEFPGDKYPDYTAGSTYLISGAAVPLLHNASKYNSPIAMEDVYITGILSSSSGVQLVHEPGFVYLGPLDICHIQKQVITKPGLNSEWQLPTVWGLINHQWVEEECDSNNTKLKQLLTPLIS